MGPPLSAMVPVRYRQVEKSTASKWCVQTTKEDDQTSLQICHGDDCTVCCDHCVLTVADESFKVEVREHQVHIDGEFMKASADKVTRSHHKDQLVLEGHVKMQYNRDGQKAEMSAAMIVVDLVDGTVKMKPAPVDEGQIFQFIMGFFN
jgi:hypothetical protein